MYIAAELSFNGGDIVKTKYADLYKEIKHIISTVDAEKFKTKVSEEKTKKGKLLYDPTAINNEFEKIFTEYNWNRYRVKCLYSTDYYTEEYCREIKKFSNNAYREMDFVKNRLGVEVQLGKYAFMVYNVCAKMTIFHNQDVIDMGVEIVPVKSLAQDMSSGVSYFEQFEWDLRNRGTSNIDIPVLIIGVDSKPTIID